MTSATAVANHIDNTVPSHFIPALEQLCKTILEPLRAFAQRPIIISSGYRCNALNVKVGGAYASQHTLGEAADIFIPKTSYTDWDDNKAHTDKELAEVGSHGSKPTPTLINSSWRPVMVVTIGFT